MKKLEAFAFVWLVGVATFLAIPSYRAINNIARTSWNEDARLGQSHERLNAAIDKVGEGVADAGGSILGVGKTLTVGDDEHLGTLPALVNIAGGTAASIVSPEGSLHQHINNVDTYLRVASRGVYEAATAVQDTAEHTTQLEDAAAGEVPALAEHFGHLSEGGANLMQAWTLAGTSVSDHLPLLLKDADKTVRIAGFIGKDIHSYTFAAIHPKHWYQEPGAYGKVGMLACRLLCPQL